MSLLIPLLLCFWALLYLLDSSLKIRWYSSRFNRTLVRIGSAYSWFWLGWFTCGAVFGCVAMVLSQVLLMWTVFSLLTYRPAEEQVLVPVMPGVNLPMNQIWYYLLTLFVCGVFHEIGHAVAAVREKVRVNGFGVFLLILYPGAYVDLSTEHMQSARPLTQLRIYCAGVWHNFIIVIGAIATLFLLPTLLSPIYSVGSSSVVTYVTEDSPVYGARGLSIGDHIIRVNDCPISSTADWTECIRDSMSSKQAGFCMSLEDIHRQDTAIRPYGSPVECCSNLTYSHLCFSYHVNSSPNSSYACLAARSTSQGDQCLVSTDCKSLSGDLKTEFVCVTPVVSNTTRLLRVQRRDKPAVLFFGHPLDLYVTVHVSNYVPRFSWLPSDLLYILGTFCRYLVSLSGALAILNVVPCYALDGHWILQALLDYVLPSSINLRTRATIFASLLLTGTVTILMNIAVGIWYLIART